MTDFVAFIQLVPLSGAIGVALIAAPAGSFLVWRRMAYFGDSLSHAALLGVALGIVSGANVSVAIVLVCVVLAVLFVGIGQNRALASDTLLGIMAHSGLAIGLVAISLTGGEEVDLEAYLFGDLLAVDGAAAAWIWIVAALSALILFAIWRPLLSLSVNEDLARVEGVRADRIRLAFMGLLALVVAAAIQVVGVLLITALLIIPAAAARRFVTSPEAMAALAAVLAVLSVIAGLAGSLIWAIPAGPAIVVAALVLFLGGLVLPSRG